MQAETPTRGLLTLTHRTAVCAQVDDGSRSAAEGRANDRIADDSSALARAHHAAVMLSCPLGAVVIEFALVETA